MHEQPNRGDKESLGVELDRALEREAATREILRVISQSRSDTGPVFDAIVENASRLCNAPLAFLSIADEARSRVTIPAALGERSQKILTGFDQPIDATHLIAVRPIVDGKVIHIADCSDTERYRKRDPYRVALVEVEGVRTILAVPMISNGISLGAILLYRREVKLFDADQIELAKTFADQAAIAIENVRQFRELQTRLEREVATRDVLSAISKSRDDTGPVFARILDSAARLCSSPHAILLLRSPDKRHLELAASNSAESKFVEHLQKNPHNLSDKGLLAVQALENREALHIRDIQEIGERPDRPPQLTAAIELEHMRTVLIIPLVRGDRAIGVICLYKLKVSEFSDDECAMVETFAAQAVIAIENVRQFGELQTRLEHETATRDILQVISQSRADETPVFDAILSNAQRLCGAPFGFLSMMTEDGEHLEIMADGTKPFEPFRTGWRWPMKSKLLVTRSVRERTVLQLEDVALDPLYTQGDEDRVTVVKAGVRTVLTVPLVSDGLGIGSIALFRREMRPFAPDEIALVQTFAEQAVIAIENVRQFKELETLNAELGDRVEEQVGEIERMGRLKRFLPSAVADTVVSSGSEEMLKSHRVLLGVLFCDIRGFTAFCETAEPEETIEVLQTYHEEMGALIAAHGAGVDTRAGDGIMVLFNDPLPCEDPAGDALRLGLAMRSRMQELCKAWKRHGHKLGFGVGISLGYATVGMVGSEGRYDYTASGTAVNLAARLCDKAEDGDILLSPRAYAAVDEEFTADAIGEIALKGIHATVEVFRVSEDK